MGHPQSFINYIWMYDNLSKTDTKKDSGRRARSDRAALLELEISLGVKKSPKATKRFFVRWTFGKFLTTSQKHVIK
ncbi:MAG: hypothetical protein C4520_14595 [Candidatus Abyssobacteria bacterium SURF_5]|uniref:Uncharacterized protein n=1 Tax=Abyssobacteria bacterium (strain SURF_5) TaxID=2093360 RepID=A0A3A4NRC9_ABYX5|nr:MAG: hypothetical protein C4520_14595 [Candidatus Abyssubacteria bacterium SURF_5]